MLETLLYPKAIAVIGASRNPDKVGYAVLANLVNNGFQGPIVPINLEADEILGLKCYKSLDEYKDPDRPQHRHGRRQIREGRPPELHQRRRQIGHRHHRRLPRSRAPRARRRSRNWSKSAAPTACAWSGPNCLGVLNTDHQMNATFAPSVPPPGKISVISQSGALCVAILDWAAEQKLGLGKVISFGNKADLNEVDFIQTLAEDKETKVIAGYLESIKEGDKFLRIAEQAASIKPVVILKVGVTQAGAKAASSHTGSLAGADIAYGAAFKRAGVIRAENFEALFDYATAFAMQPLPQGERVAIITNAGGPGIMAADAAESLGTENGFAEPRRATAKLRAFLPASAAFGNPDGRDRRRRSRPLRQSLRSRCRRTRTIDAIVVVVTPQNMTRPLELAEKLAAAHHGKKPVLAAFMGGTEVAAAKEKLMAVGIPNYPSPDRAVTALRAMCDYAAWKRRPPRIVTRFPVNRRRVDRIIHTQMRSGEAQIGEVEAKEILRAYDFNVLGGQLARTGDEAVEIAERLGYPVVLKISSPDIIHKSDFGGVRINLANAEQVRDAFDLMMLRIQRRAPNAHLRGALRREDGPARPRGDSGHDARSAVRADADVRPRRHFRRGDEGRDVPPGADHGGGGDADVERHAFLRAAARARAARRRWIWTPSPARSSASASSPPIIRKSRNWTSTLHRRAGRRPGVRGRCPHDPFKFLNQQQPT